MPGRPAGGPAEDPFQLRRQIYTGIAPAKFVQTNLSQIDQLLPDVYNAQDRAKPSNG